MHRHRDQITALETKERLSLRMHSVAIELVREVKYRTVHVLVHVCFISQPRNRGSSYFTHCSIRSFWRKFYPPPLTSLLILFSLYAFGSQWLQFVTNSVVSITLWGRRVSHLDWPSPTELHFCYQSTSPIATSFVSDIFISVLPTSGSHLLRCQLVSSDTNASEPTLAPMRIGRINP